ncbi:ankyrin repeat protein, putative [Trichomonas vaginalis G3]|uniref:Ankyrin repeat protein, putative n=1 Tax=Trichomonas vaginalis (strain ATCC PRA-98 / G3) TaxID=412133 RepID=A2E9Q1_TRIV3|nr:protein ubiquitination [Trichomonas vaginalis G3]EAY10586.1 ankyrin repeat protein, putative [Trichomonas vaginalis G3]KAI5540838.1 protein ubiquitination [Trichomonas vaginalis G3]|eukprot:XP_001322809.1 ankyrin repeat protein [Trichomonas vaginalis G3]
MSISCAVGLSEKRDEYEYTPLLQACNKGDLELTKSLIERGCARDAIDKNGNNCLFNAAFKGHLVIVKYLVENGIDKNYRDNNDEFSAIL